jgi:hypothetical protein
MTRLEKCIKAKEMGYVYDPETGIVYGTKGTPLNTNNNGYVEIAGSYPNNRLRLMAHTFGFWWVHGTTPSHIDHIDQNRKNNKISNLRQVTNQQNAFNTPAKGYNWDPVNNKWRARIMLNKKSICLGRYNTEEEARNAYLEGKKVYHIIP